MKPRRITLVIQDLDRSGSGASAVEQALERVPGVSQVYINPAMGMAYVKYDPALSGPEQFIAAVERAGFRAEEPSQR